MKILSQDITQLWSRALETIKDRMNDKHIFSAFLANSKIAKVDSDTFYIIVDTKLAKQVMSGENEYKTLVINVIHELTESNYNVTFLEQSEVDKEPKETPVVNTLFASSYLKSDMTFDNFIVGESNKEAYQAALLNASSKNILWNPSPLFLYSDSGLGKTHLLNAIGNAIKENNPNKKVLITTAEEFFNEYIKIVKVSTLEQQLTDYFLNIDVLLIDDIQFFTGKKKCQELFFAVFSKLIAQNKIVVITSDKHPNELKDIEDRLITRFNGGLSISINPPDLTTSMEIIKNYVKTSGMDITRIEETVFPFFAEKFSKNVRELKGAINKLLFYTINIKEVNLITLANAKEAVCDYLKADENNKKVTEAKIIDIVSNYYSLTPTQLTGSVRTGHIAMARHIAMYLIRNLLDTPFDSIGKAFGGKDHSTVMSACKNVEKGLKTNPSLLTVINELKTKLNA